jgi:Flp pilus assembly protein TadB
VVIRATLAAPAGGTPLVTGRAGQRLARSELAKAIYHPQGSLVRRVLHAISALLGRLFHTTSGLPGGWWAVVTLAACAVIVTAVVRARIGPVARSARRAAELAAPGLARTASEHRAAGQRLAAAGDFAGAICECVRAIAAGLNERGVLAPRGGRTADELAAEAGRALPQYDAELRAAAQAFDEVRYGQRPGSRAGYERVANLETRIRARSAAGRTP